jgi:hypothetical protein
MFRNYLVFIVTLAVIIAFARSQSAYSWQGFYSVNAGCDATLCSCVSGIVAVKAVNSNSLVVNGTFFGQNAAPFTVNIDNVSSPTTINTNILGDSITLTRTSNGITIQDNNYTSCSSSATFLSKICPSSGTSYSIHSFRLESALILLFTVMLLSFVIIV